MKRQITAVLLACIAAVAVAVAASAADEMVFDKYKGRMYAAYAQELKTHPGLKGKVLLEMKVTTDGRVTGCRVVSSIVPSPTLGETLCERARQFQFGARPAATTFTKEIEFFAAG